MIIGPVSGSAPTHFGMDQPIVATENPHGEMHGHHARADDTSSAHVPCDRDGVPCHDGDAGGCRHVGCLFAFPLPARIAMTHPVFRAEPDAVPPARLAGREIAPPVDPPRRLA
jgi:hypothetical protein